jgi:hypothetical protein
MPASLTATSVPEGSNQAKHLKLHSWSLWAAVLLLYASGSVLAQANPVGAPAASASAKLTPTVPASTAGLAIISSKPEWRELTPAQQLSLKPLAANWNSLGEGQKRKWIAIAANYPQLSPTEQSKLHERMTEWVALSPKQREQARLNFAQTKQLSPSQKAENWQAYQALSAEEKKKLAIAAAPKPGGAAPAVKPVPPQKLAAVPVTRKTASAPVRPTASAPASKVQAAASQPTPAASN